MDANSGEADSRYATCTKAPSTMHQSHVSEREGTQICLFDEDFWKNTNLSRSEIDSLENQQGKMKKIFLSANGSQLGGS